MNVSLTPELERFIREKVDSGRYQSSSEVVREALRLLEEQERLREQLQSEIQKGLDSGEPIDGPEALDRLLAKYETMASATDSR
ncbi:MAG: type II toxin-antitoxin system ParD family antitoxin [Geminicoccaceae bacterium]|nr:type II toxin-antitoxin system ParD family antitoxin [Geminicoccaceae bacterium]